MIKNKLQQADELLSFAEDTAHKDSDKITKARGLILDVLGTEQSKTNTGGYENRADIVGNELLGWLEKKHSLAPTSDREIAFEDVMSKVKELQDKYYNPTHA